MDKASVDKVAGNAWDLANEIDTNFKFCVLLRDCAFTIKELQSRIADLEQDAARWKAATRDLDINDVAVVVYDKYGDERVVTGDDADSAIDAAMQKD